MIMPEALIFGFPIEKARDAIFFSPGLTMASLTERALVLDGNGRRKSTATHFPRALAPRSRLGGR